MAELFPWSYPLLCPACGTAGAVYIDEATKAAARDKPSRAYVIKGAFRIRPGRVPNAEAVFECESCGAVAN